MKKICGLEIDKDMFEQFCGYQPTPQEIASFFKTSTKTLNEWCLRVYKEDLPYCLDMFGAAGRMGLRASQFRMAEKNVVMNIWLSKQFLGQRDFKEQAKVDEPITIVSGSAEEQAEIDGK